MAISTREKIIRTSLKLFSEYGYDTVSLKEIAFETSVKRDELVELFADKAAIVKGILDYIPRVLQHYRTTQEELRQALEEETPEQLLMRFIVSYYWQEDPVRLQVYRFLYMEQYRQEQVRAAAYEHLIHTPVRNISHALDLLVKLGAIPPCDCRALAEMWDRTSLVFSMQDAHNDVCADSREYFEAMRFIVGLIVNGVQPMDVEQVDAQWNYEPFGPELQLNGDVKKRILFTAFELFGEHGYSNVPMRMIAEALNISTSTLYQYYKTKAEILQQIGDMMMDRYAQYTMDNPAFAAVMQQRDPFRIALMLCSSFPPIKEEYVLRLYRILFREQFLNETIKDIFVGGIFREIDAVEQLLDGLVSEGRIQALDTHNLAVVYVHTMCSLTVGATVFWDDVEGLDELRMRVVTLFTSFVLNGSVKGPMEAAV